MRAAALYRVSTLKQVKNNQEETIPLQQHAVYAFVAQKGWELAAEYFESGVSAYKKSFKNRDVIQDIIKDAAAGKFDVLLVFKADRLSRNSFEYPLVLWELSKLGITVISVADEKVLNIEDQAEKLIRFIEGWQAETESRNTSIRVSRAMIDMARKGKWSGGRPPYGFRYSQKKNVSIEIDPEEARVIQIMFEMAEDGAGGNKIAKWLNQQGYRTKNGRLWTGYTVRRVMQNPIVAGLPAYNRSTRRDKSSCSYDLNNPEIIIPRDENGNPLPIPELQIIPLETWLKVTRNMRQIAEHSKISGRAIESTSLLTGFLKCGSCGRGFLSSTRRLPNGKIRRAYVCSTKNRRGSQFCNGQTQYEQHIIDKIFMDELEQFLQKIDLGDLAEYLRGKQAASLSIAQKRERELNREISKAKRILDSWVERLNMYFADPHSSLYSEERIATEISKWEKNIRELEESLSAVRNELQTAVCEQDKVKAFMRVAPRWLELFKSSPVPVKKKMLAQIIDRVVLSGKQIEIYYNVNLLEVERTVGASEQQQGEIKLKVIRSI
ncbi:recombinase family protein [Desulfofundulus sp. TPOSR]|uniref:recombinase family protein n=1 Tax=Desulfofundulus sp. TPOSR TaxID=2714340 RepID=UPI00140A62C9|nr:recombinase family protein [Desulfofundulus sp. TPOSR]NHM28881.1 recombinase family protein [Desulfofundulus sp. TPOSR]